MPEVRIAFDTGTDKYVIIVDNKIFAENIPTHEDALAYRNIALSRMEMV